MHTCKTQLAKYKTLDFELFVTYQQSKWSDLLLPNPFDIYHPVKGKNFVSKLHLVNSFLLRKKLTIQNRVFLLCIFIRLESNYIFAQQKPALLLAIQNRVILFHSFECFTEK